MAHIQIIIGSTRPGRLGKPLADWFLTQVEGTADATFEIVDLQEVGLPFLDEPIPAGSKKYSQDHTNKWSELISKGDGYVWVTPEYNHGTSASLKNAIDYLFFEWNYKPVSFLGYGSMGATRAIENLVSVASELKMVPLRERVLVVEPWSAFDEAGIVKQDFVKGDPKNVASELVKWSNATRQLRDDI